VKSFQQKKENNMEDSSRTDNKPDPGKLEALRNLPEAIMKDLTKEEINAFLYEEEWPDSLVEKLKAYMVTED
jgi:hypothetical protein